MIAGFNTVDGGEIRFDEKVINNLPAHKRDIGMVFQNYAIFPHLTVEENVAYGLKAKKVPKGCLLYTSYTALATMVQVYGEEFAARFARNLKGRCADGSGDIIPLVADGTYSVGITLESTVQKAIADGAEVAYLYPCLLYTSRCV